MIYTYLINTDCLFFRNPHLPQISTFSSGQKNVLIMREVLIWGVLIMSLHSRYLLKIEKFFSDFQIFNSGKASETKPIPIESRS